MQKNLKIKIKIKKNKKKTPLRSSTKMDLAQTDLEQQNSPVK